MSLGIDDLVGELDKLLTLMQNKGMMPTMGDKEKEDLLKTVAENVLQGKGNVVSVHDLQDPKFLKSLCLSIASQHINNLNGKFNFDYKKLFDPNLIFDPKEHKEEFKALFKILLMELNQLSPRKFNDKAIDQLADQMAYHAIENYMDPTNQNQDCMLENDRITGTLTELLILSLRNLYGGENPNKPGSVVVPVEEIIGNLFGIANPQPQGDGSMAFIDEIYNYPFKGNPLGGDQITLLESITNLYEVNISPNPFKMQPPNEPA